MKELEGLLSFLTLLRNKGISFNISQERDDAIMVAFGLVGIRVEVDFFVDHIEFSTFEGDESVHSNEQALIGLIDKHL